MSQPEYYVQNLGGGMYDIRMKPQVINIKFSRLAELLETSGSTGSNPDLLKAGGTE